MYLVKMYTNYKTVLDGRYLQEFALPLYRVSSFLLIQQPEIQMTAHWNLAKLVHHVTTLVHEVTNGEMQITK